MVGNFKFVNMVYKARLSKCVQSPLENIQGTMAKTAVS